MMKRALIGLGALALPALVYAQASGVDLSKAKLRTPSALTEQAPANFKAKFDTSKGAFVVEVHRDWAPKGADRFYNLVKNGFFDDARFFRVVPDFMVQFGINGDPNIQKNWANANITDDPVTKSNKRGYITFATRGKDTRTTQLCINVSDDTGHDRRGVATSGEVGTGMDIVDKITTQYGEKPNQGSIQAEGNAYLNKEFPKLDYIKKATIEKERAGGAGRAGRAGGAG